jgi:hypothetical protein
MGLAQDAYGVVGASDHWDGVTGQSYWSNGITGSSAQSFGVDAATDLGPAAIRAQAIGGTGYGVLGIAAGNAGIFGMNGSGGPTPTTTAGVIGTSDQYRGIIGTSNAHQGVYGFSSLNAGVVGESGSAQSFGGYFFGNVHMTGTLTSDSVKGAVVPFPDGTKRLLVCVESPEPWFEDFGAAKLKRGRAVVKIDRDFAKVIKRGDYHVFLTPRGDCRGLCVRSQGGASFEVRELAGGTSSVVFSYRIVGRRKDIKGHRRFAKIDTRLPLPVPRARPARQARRMKTLGPTPAELRAFAARMAKEARARLPKRRRKGKRSAK